ncbi:MAG: hypothetical protein HY680_03665 [Chloroflexi bacterium]|nr:hypothetical protein [Chloroflexota bacterium]
MTNYERLGEGLKLYRDAVRPFVVEHLRRAFPQDDWMEHAVFPYLRPNQADSLRTAISRASAAGLFETPKKAEDHLDLQHLGPIVRGNWERVFKTVLGGTQVIGYIQEAGIARNAWAHPAPEDLPTADVNRALDSCARVLALVDRTIETKVIALRDQGLSGTRSEVQLTIPGNASSQDTADRKESAPAPASYAHVPPGVLASAEATGENAAAENGGYDFPDAFGLWQSLRNYLRTEVECDPPENLQNNPQVEVRVVIKNVSPAAPGWPQIVFEDIQVSASRPGHTTGGRINTKLESGGSTVQVLKYQYSELAAVRFHVTARLSLESFFSFQEDTAVSVKLTKPLVIPYLRAFNELEIHKVLDTILVSVALPAPETTFAEIQRTVNSINGAMTWVKETQGKLQAMHYSLGEDFSKQQQAAYQYLIHLGAVAEKLKSAFGSTLTEDLAESLAAVSDLFAERNAVNVLTEGLMDDYALSDEEVGYMYHQPK